MYYDTIILRFFNNELINKEKNYYFNEESAYRKHFREYVEFYWRIRITTKKTHETQGSFISFGELKKYFNDIFPILTSHLKFDNPNINGDTIVFVKFSGRGKNLGHNLTDLRDFIYSIKCTGFDIKYGIFLNELDSYIRNIHKSSRKNDIACHNENGYAMYGYLKNNEWECYKHITSVIILRDTNIDIRKEMVTAFYFEYTNNIPTISFMETEFISLQRKFKLTQIFSE
jgi:hypothetical protein